MLALVLAAVLAQASPAPPRLEDGIRLIDQGDYEAAVAALRSTAAAIAGDPTRAVERARAYLYLGVAQHALGQAADAHASFVAALRDDPGLRVTEERFSPKVVTAFAAARREVTGSTATKGGGGKVAVAAVAGAAVAAGAVLALGGADSGPLRLENARFSPPDIECPDNSNQLPITFTVQADIRNDGSTATVLSTSVTVIITASDAPEVGFSSERPSLATPTSLLGGRVTAVRIQSTLVCGNGPGGPSRTNEWTARFTITTSAGTLGGETSNRLRVISP
jgi:hypothetical protein